MRSQVRIYVETILTAEDPLRRTTAWQNLAGILRHQLNASEEQVSCARDSISKRRMAVVLRGGTADASDFELLVDDLILHNKDAAD